jgi:hypothetical protein
MADNQVTQMFAVGGQRVLPWVTTLLVAVLGWAAISNLNSINDELATLNGRMAALQSQSAAASARLDAIEVKVRRHEDRFDAYDQSVTRFYERYAPCLAQCAP